MSVTLDVMFVNRSAELDALAEWWEGSPGAGAIALVWGRRRVGKTALLSAFAKGRRTVFHTGAGRPARDELSILSRATAVKDHRNSSELLMRIPHLVERATCWVSGFVEAVA